MLKRILVILLVLVMAAPALAEEAHPEGNPWVNSDIYGRWPSERPGPEDQYELWVNYDYYQEALAKGDSATSELPVRSAAQANIQMMELVRDPGKTGTEEKILHILYGFYADTEKMERDGLSPLMEQVNQLKALRTTEELTVLLRQDGWRYGEAFFQVGIGKSGEPADYRIEVNTVPFLPEIPLTEEDFEKNPTVEAKPDLERARQLLLRMEYSEEEIPQLLEKLAGYNPNGADGYTPTSREDELWNKMVLSLEEIREVCPQAAEMLEGMGLVKEGAETEELYNVQISQLIAFREFYREENLETLKAAAALLLFQSVEKWLDPSAGRGYASKIEESYHADPFLGYIPNAVVDQAYVHNFVSKELEEEYYALAEEYRDAMRVRISQAEWADPETKQRATEKLDKMVVAKLLYPDGEFDCSGLLANLQGCKNLMEAELRCSEFYRKTLMSFAGRPVIRGNRYFSSESALGTGGKFFPLENAFYIGAATLVGETYNGTSRETVLATIGYHLAHELSHAFDTYGGMYDALGGDVPIFSETGMAGFQEKVTSIIGRAGRVEVLDGLNILGMRMSGEIIADMEGVRLSLDLAKKEESFDYDLFFRTYAAYFNWYYSDRDVYYLIFSDEVHPSPFFRVNFSVQYMDEFYETYPSVVEGTPMYLSPEERTLVW